jgi:hypothetical protein
MVISFHRTPGRLIACRSRNVLIDLLFDVCVPAFNGIRLDRAGGSGRCVDTAWYSGVFNYRHSRSHQRAPHSVDSSVPLRERSECGSHRRISWAAACLPALVSLRYQMKYLDHSPKVPSGPHEESATVRRRDECRALDGSLPGPRPSCGSSRSGGPKSSASSSSKLSSISPSSSCSEQSPETTR